MIQLECWNSSTPSKDMETDAMQDKETLIKEKISGMSLDQKVGAMLTLGFNGTIITPNILEYVTKDIVKLFI